MGSFNELKEKTSNSHYHKFLDEAGDTTFFGKGNIPLLGTSGVLNYFLLGMLTVHEPLHVVRSRVINLQSKILNDPYFLPIPSILKKKNKK